MKTGNITLFIAIALVGCGGGGGSDVAHTYSIASTVVINLTVLQGYFLKFWRFLVTIAGRYPE